MKKIVVLFLLLISGCGVPTLDDLILRPNPDITQTPLNWGFNYEETTININEERSIVVWHVPSKESKALVVIFPGSDANKGLYTEALPLFIPEGFDILLMDYEGYGSSPGKPSLRNTVEDTLAVAEYAITLHKNVFLFGVSLGTPLVVNAASQYDFKGCILEGTLILDEEPKLWLTDNNKNFPLLWILGNLYVHPQSPPGFDIVSNIKNVDEPNLFMHSIEDEITPYGGGVEIFRLASDPKEFWTMRGGHGRMIRLDTELYKTHVINWLNSNLKENENAR